MEGNTQPGRNGGTLKKGGSKGRPKGTLSLTEELKRQLAKGKNLEELIASAIEQAKQGNSANLKLIFDRVEGPMAQKVEIDDVTGLTDDELLARARAAGVIGGNLTPGTP